MANVSFPFPPLSHLTDTDSGRIPAADIDGGDRQRPPVPGVSEFPSRIPIGVSLLPVTESSKAGDVRKQAGRQPTSVASLELLSNYWNGMKRPKVEKLPGKAKNPARINRQRLSTEEIMRVAGTRFIQLQDRKNDNISAITQRFDSDFSGLSEEDMKEVDLIQLLLAAAEKVGEKEFDRASRLLSYCEMLSSKRTSSAERVVLLFVKALRERINKVKGEHDPKRLVLRNHSYLKTNTTLVNCLRLLPFFQIAQFSGIQVLVENTASASRVHVVDLSIRSGVHIIILMQALLDRKSKAIELLKVSAVATTERDKVEESGKRLVNVAKSMGLNFSFTVIPVQDIDDIREDMFDIEDGEAVAVYSPMVLKMLISRQKSLENLTKVIKSLNPSVMVITEIQANHNSPSFVTRFIEGLFFYSAFMDCLAICLANDLENNMVSESSDDFSEQYLFSGITNMLSTEGEERIIRNVKIDVWRAFFTRNGMVEIGLSESSLYHARLVTQQFPYASFCTLERNGKCLIIGWRGTPLLSLSAWKFRR